MFFRRKSELRAAAFTSKNQLIIPLSDGLVLFSKPQRLSNPNG
jgi:hypothetical protein